MCSILAFSQVFSRCMNNSPGLFLPSSAPLQNHSSHDKLPGIRYEVFSGGFWERERRYKSQIKALATL
ncbi:hypothetical protein BDR05DRAFT_290802 [Suillus weaverae]|nr:hypothetical protein BDR05DRAFT_290802 [Suillus weaverae]